MVKGAPDMQSCKVKRLRNCIYILELNTNLERECSLQETFVTVDQWTEDPMHNFKDVGIAGLQNVVDGSQVSQEGLVEP